MSGVIAQNLHEIEDRILLTCKKAGRPRSEIRLVAVSKTFPPDFIIEAIKAGQLDFGENYIPEGSQKAAQIKGLYPETRFHFIGHMQRNKVRSVVADFDLIQTVDRIELGQEIDKEAKKVGKNVPVLLQVNISGEETKSGCEPKMLKSLAESAASLSNLTLKGIMSIGSGLSLDMREERSISIVTHEFEEMRSLKKDLESGLGFLLPELSMGMSGDFELAIETGATIIRVGTSIFGSR